MITSSNPSENGASTIPQGASRPPAKWAVVLNDALFPMPRRHLTARDLLDQTGSGPDVVLQRDFNSPHDQTFADDAMIDLGEGNVFRTIARCTPTAGHQAEATPKLAFVVDDAWEVTVVARQTGRTLKRLLGLPDAAQLLRDLESPNDVPIQDDEVVLFPDGPVFTARQASLSVTVNNQKVVFERRRVNGLEIKQTAIAQGVKIETGFVLYRIKPDGSLGPAIRDDEKVLLKDCEAFSCVAPDDNS